MNNITGKTKLQ